MTPANAKYLRNCANVTFNALLSFPTYFLFFLPPHSEGVPVPGIVPVTPHANIFMEI